MNRLAQAFFILIHVLNWYALEQWVIPAEAGISDR
jgi:hypothetical protein